MLLRRARPRRRRRTFQQDFAALEVAHEPDAAAMTLGDLPLELRTKILGRDNLPDLVDLARVRAVSHAMRDAVDDTGREISEKTCCCCAAEMGCLSTLQNQLRRGLLDEAVVCESAALGGHLEILRWARQHGFEWGVRTSSRAAAGGHLKVLKWLRENGCPWDDDIGWFAAQNGHMDVLRWAHDTGCPLTEWTFAFAADGGRLDVLRWLPRAPPAGRAGVRVRGEGRLFRRAGGLRSISARGTNARARGRRTRETSGCWRAHGRRCPWDAWSCGSGADRNLETPSGCAPAAARGTADARAR